MIPDLLADLLAAFVSGPPANPAKAAKREHRRGLRISSGSANGCENLRRGERLSQEFAPLRNPQDDPKSKHRRGFSQDSRLSQKVAGDVQVADAPLAVPLNADARCTDCLHSARYGNCTRPEGAGLIPAGEGFGIKWAPRGHAADCATFEARPLPEERPYRLDSTQGATSHALVWDGGAIERFEGFALALRRQGFTEGDAEDLAERSHLARVEGDDRRPCIECRHLARSVATGWRCKDGETAGVVNPLPPELVTLAQRCPAFTA